jgi:hypothetical protein
MHSWHMSDDSLWMVAARALINVISKIIIISGYIIKEIFTIIWMLLAIIGNILHFVLKSVLTILEFLSRILENLLGKED